MNEEQQPPVEAYSEGHPPVKGPTSVEEPPTSQETPADDVPPTGKRQASVEEQPAGEEHPNTKEITTGEGQRPIGVQPSNAAQSPAESQHLVDWGSMRNDQKSHLMNVRSLDPKL